MIKGPMKHNLPTIRNIHGVKNYHNKSQSLKMKNVWVYIVFNILILSSLLCLLPFI